MATLSETPPSTDAAHAGLKDAFYAIGLVTLIVAVLTLGAKIFVPIALAILLWFLVNAFAGILKRAPIFGRVITDGVALILATIATLGLVWLAGQIVIANLAQLSNGFQNLDERIAGAVSSLEAATGLAINFDLSRITDFFSLQTVLRHIISAIGQIASEFSLILLFMLFLLLDQPYYEAKIKALFPDRQRQARIRKVLRKIGEDTRIYIWLMTVVSVITGCITYVIATAYDLQGAAFWGFAAFALNFIPTIGSFLGVLIPGAYAFVQFDQPENALTFMLALSVVQFVMGNLVLPRLMGDRLNLSQFVVILSLSIWSAMWGVAGLFLAVPLMMVLAIVLSQFESTRPVAIIMSKTGQVMRR
jgi:predicted PurR-regulated permease PerM